GLVTTAGGLASLPVSLIRYAKSDHENDTALLQSSLWTVGGLVLTSLGIVGDYVGKIYLETKHRPRYFIAEVLDNRKD
ncbi:MAG: glycosyltransferase, partial [Acutalibacteraceae bacterium]|nr:glycosyltransferase [Acutalibacteraceae bacterium]